MSARLSAAPVDPRGLRFAAAMTAAVLAVVVLTESAWLLAVQAGIFAVGGFAGVRRSPYAVIFSRLIRPRLAPPRGTEDARPPQFAQLVGLVFSVVGLAGFAGGLTTLGLVATGLALGAAFLQAAFGICLGCEIYLTIRRMTPGPRNAVRLAVRRPTTEVSA